MGFRIGWLISSEAFLFAAYASAAGAKHPGGVVARLRDVLPGLGIAIAVLVYFAIFAAIWAVKRLRAGCPTPEELKPLRFPPMVGSDATHYLGLVPAVLLPAALIAAWIIILT